MQSYPPNRVSVRPRSLTFVLAGAVLLLVGDALGYTWTLYFAINYPYYYLSGLEWSTLASIASFIGMVVYAIGFFLMLYGIALRIRVGERALVPGFVPGTEPVAAFPSRPPVSGTRRSAASLVLLGAGLYVAGYGAFLGGDVVMLLAISFEGQRLVYLVDFVTRMVQTLGLVLALYGIALFLHRPQLPRTPL